MKVDVQELEAAFRNACRDGKLGDENKLYRPTENVNNGLDPTAVQEGLKEWAKEIERVFAKARRSAAGGVKKPRKVVVARKYHRGNAGGPSVDKRQLADLRGQRASAKRAGKGGRGGGKGKGKGGRGRGR